MVYPKYSIKTCLSKITNFHILGYSYQVAEELGDEPPENRRLTVGAAGVAQAQTILEWFLRNCS